MGSHEKRLILIDYLLFFYIALKRINQAALHTKINISDAAAIDHQVRFDLFQKDI